MPDKKKKRLREIISILRKNQITKGFTPEKLELILADLGPTYIKIGQILSMRKDLLPKEYCDHLQNLQTDVNPISYEEVQEILIKELGNIEEIFSYIEPEPLGAASIAQVHKAILKNTGEEVVIKVQRPDLYETMETDIILLKRIAKIFNKVSNVTHLDFIDFEAVIDELWIATQKEIDFKKEASNAEKFAKLNEKVSYFDSPTINKDLTTEKVLVMNYIPGVEIDKFDILKANGYDLNDLSKKLSTNYIKQVLKDGFFHADPHPGNLKVHDGKIAWMDLGMMGELSEKERDIFYEMVEGITFNDTEKVYQAFLKLGNNPKNIDDMTLYQDVQDMLGKYREIDIDEIDIGNFIEEFITLCSENNIILPSDITMLARGMATLESVVTELSPNLNVVNIMSDYVEEEKKDNIKKELKNLTREAVSSAKSSLEIPISLKEVLNLFTKGHSKLNINLIGLDDAITALAKMVNRVVLGIITAALLISSSFLATTNMNPKIFGIPFLGFVGFLGSVVLGLWIIFTMIVQDKTLDKNKDKGDK